MKPNLLTLMYLSTFSVAAADDLDIANQIRYQGFYNSHVMHTLQHLTDNIGPRLTGSEQLLAANQWTKQQLIEWGLKNAQLDPFEFGRGWSFDSASIDLIAPRKTSLHGIPVAWTPGTKGPVSGEVMIFDAVTKQELQRFRGKISGKFLLIGDASSIGEPTKPVFKRYDGKTLDQLKDFPAEHFPSHESGITQARKDKGIQRHFFKAELRQFLAQEKPAGVIYASRRQGGIITVNGKSHKLGETFPVPAITIEQEHFNLLTRFIDSGKTPKITLAIKAQFHDDDTKAYNTIAEIPGSDPDPEIVMVGGHLDSWHASGGAVDNGAGVAVSMEAMRILMTLGIKPKRTIRIALWAGEEQGLYGSRAYVEKHFASRPKPQDPKVLAMPDYLWKDQGWPITPQEDYEKFSVYFNMDGGSGRLRGIFTEGNVAVKPIFSKWFSPYSDLSTGTVSNNSDNYTDHEAFDDVGLPGFQFIQDPLDYSTRLHHTHLDSWDHAVADDLKQASVIMASFLYQAATMEKRLPRKPMPVKPSPLIEQEAALKAEKARRKREREANQAIDIRQYQQ